MRELYQRLIAAGKAHKVAVMRKLIVMLNSLIRGRQKWIREPL